MRASPPIEVSADSSLRSAARRLAEAAEIDPPETIEGLALGLDTEQGLVVVLPVEINQARSQFGQASRRSPVDR